MMNKNVLMLSAVFFALAIGVAWAQQSGLRVSGNVIDVDSGEPLSGVSIRFEGTDGGTTTDAQGRYTLEVPNLNGVLVASYVGFHPLRINISGRTQLDFSLEQASETLEQVVVVGYGSQRRKDITGSISYVSSGEIENQPLPSIDQLLQGKAPGVQISNASGAPGGRVNIRIRGASSVNAGNEPLFVIDGIPVYNSSRDPSGTSYGTFTPTNALASLNPNDIESVAVLKDASATAIYGSRGNNGVILITTKRGSGEQVRVDYNGYYGTQRLIRKLDLMDGAEHAAFLNDWADEGAMDRPFANPQALGKGTDWQDELFRSAPIQNHQLSLSNGRGNTKYFISANYFNQEGIALNSGMERYSIRVNVDNKINDKLTFSQSLTFNRSLNRAVPTNSAGADNIRSVADKVFATSPTMSVYDENGNYVTDWWGGGKTESPLASLLTIQNMLTGDNLLGNLSLDYEIIEGLTFKTLWGVNLMNRSNEEYYPRETTYIGGILGGLGMLSESRFTNILNENTLHFSKNIAGSHQFDLLGGFTWQTETVKRSSVQPSNFPHDRFGLDNIGSAAGVPDANSSVNEWGIASFIGRVNYAYQSKYLLTATLRADGSTKFGTGNKWGYFPSFALAYRLSEEPFLKNQDWMDDLKIRASYGITGNQEIGSYQSLARLVTNNIYIIGGQLVSGGSQSSLANNELRWERARQWDIGVDLSLFNNALGLVFDYYQKKTNDMLFQVNLPAYSGYGSALYNTGNMDNKGFEIGITGDINIGELNWDINANYSRNRSEMVSLGRSASTTLFLGYPPGVIRGYIYDGVFKSQAEIDAQTVQQGVYPGDARYRDVNGDGRLDADDLVVLGKPIPDYIFGFNNNFAFKGFTLGIFLQGEVGAQEMHSVSILDPATRGSNKLRALNDRWTPQNPDSDIPRANVGNWLASSTYNLVDQTYIKIRNIQLGYDVPSGWIPRFNRLHVYLSGQNLATFTKNYPGYDPDGGRHYPTARAIVFGVNVGI